MKKVKLFLLILSIVCFVSLTSCNKLSKINNQNFGKIKYYVAGLYIEVNEYDEFSLDDANPKVYFDFSSINHFGTLCTKTGTATSAVMFTDIAKNNKVEDDVNKYFMTANVKFVNSDVKKIKLYLIYVDKNGEFTINDEVSETVNISSGSSYNFIADFSNNKVKYNIQMKLLFK